MVSGLALYINVLIKNKKRKREGGSGETLNFNDERNIDTSNGIACFSKS